VDARHSLVLGLAKADLLVHVGMDLETGWLPTLLTSSRNGRIQAGAPGNLNCATLIQPLEVPAERIERRGGAHFYGHAYHACRRTHLAPPAKCLLVALKRSQRQLAGAAPLVLQ
jgi:hypothetical protein